MSVASPSEPPKHTPTMNNNIKENIVGAIAVIALLGVIFLSFSQTTLPQTSAGQSLGATGAGVRSPAGTILPNPSTFDYLLSRVMLESDGIFMQGGFSTTTGIAQGVTIGSCSTGTSTIFSVANPYNSTTTISQFILSGTQGASTTDIVVGTSTVLSITSGTTNAGTTTLGENLLGLASVATGTQFYTVAGVKIGPGKGYNNPAGVTGNGTYITNQEITLGPNEFLLGFSTSSVFNGTQGATGATQVATPAACTYKIEWQF